MPKKLIICCDGTWNKADQASEANKEPIPTNVVRFAYRVANSDDQGRPQIVLYAQGVGTGNAVDRLTGGAMGTGLEENIYEAYRFLIANYEKGDEIFLLGFSRGAFTARSLAGLIRNCGILRRDRIDKYKDALRLYLARDKHPYTDISKYFREQNAVVNITPIKFIGVWDTVGALGIPAGFFNKKNREKYQFHDVDLSGSVEHAYHALAIDEHREPFRPTLWENAPKPLYKPDGTTDAARNQVIEQVWFCGAHSDVGGGYGGRSEPNLSDIPLIWMMEKAEGCGLRFDPVVRTNYPLTANCCATLHDSRSLKYRAWPRLVRSIGTTPTEYIHSSALDRWETAKPDYRPDALTSTTSVPAWLATKPRVPQIGVSQQPNLQQQPPTQAPSNAADV